MLLSFLRPFAGLNYSSTPTASSHRSAILPATETTYVDTDHAHTHTYMYIYKQTHTHEVHEAEAMAVER